MTTQQPLLTEIGRHPFISVRQLCRMLEVSKSWVYERLGHMRGLVAKVNPRHPDVRSRALYYLTSKGVKHLGLPNEQDDSQLLFRIATAYQVRNFFISLQGAGLGLSAWRAVPPGPLGRSLDGVASAGRGRQLIVEWDRGERPLGLYPERLERVAKVAARAGAGLLVVPADGFRGAIMAGVLADHMGAPQLHAAVARRRAMVEGPTAATLCYAPRAGRVVSLGRFLEAVPTPRRALALADPAVKSHPEEWSGGLRRYTGLSPLQKELLCLLAGLPPLTPEELVILSRRGRSREWIRRSLVDLRRRGLVAEYVGDPGFLRRYYTVTCAGIAFLTLCCGSTPRAYAQARHWAITRDGRSGAKLAGGLRGSEEVRRVAMALARKANGRGQTITWYDGREIRIASRHGGPRHLLAPDAVVRWGNDIFFIDADCRQFRIVGPREKLEAYLDFLGRPELRFFGQRLRVLIVASEETRRDQQWLREASQLAGEREGAPLDVLVTTSRALKDRGADGPVWRGVGDEPRRVGVLGR